MGLRDGPLLGSSYRCRKGVSLRVLRHFSCLCRGAAPAVGGRPCPPQSPHFGSPSRLSLPVLPAVIPNPSSRPERPGSAFAPNYGAPGRGVEGSLFNFSSSSASRVFSYAKLSPANRTTILLTPELPAIRCAKPFQPMEEICPSAEIPCYVPASPVCCSF